MANQCVGVLCTAAREGKAATEETTDETATEETTDETATEETTEDDAAHSSFADLCTLRGLTVAAASKVIFGEGEDADSQRLRRACSNWVGRRNLSTPAVKEAAKGVRARAPFPPASCSRLMLRPPPHMPTPQLSCGQPPCAPGNLLPAQVEAYLAGVDFDALRAEAGVRAMRACLRERARRRGT